MSTTTPTHETVATDAQLDDLSDREVRALTEPMVTLDDVGPVKDSPGLYEVTSTSTYIVDMDTNDGPHCTCKDHEYRGVDCAHIERVRFATCRKPIPAWVDTDALDDQLGEHIDETPRVAMTDGGVVALGDDGGGDRDLETERVDGGVLVWEPTEFGRELAGFADVTDWDAIRSEVARRGIGVGAIYHLEEFDVEEVRA